LKGKGYNMMIVIAVTYKAKPGKREAALRAAKSCAETTRREAGNIDYTFYAGVDSPDTFFLFEQWESQKALDLHMKSEHLAAFRKVLGDLTAEPSVIRIFEASEMKK
jgi:quinol monooxygenase YgiN